MSLNIQTATGLLEIGGSVTKEKVVSALGYEPADKKVETTVDGHTKDTDIHITSDERTLWNKNVDDLDTHTSDKTVHVTSAEKETWNNKSDVKHYDELEGAPNITENDSGNMVVADENDNIIMQVDADGLTTTNVNTKTIKLDGEDLGERLDELEASSLPNIIDNESGDLTISDENDNIIMKVDANGLATTTVTAKSAVIDGVDIVTKLDEHKESINDVSGALTTHTSNTTAHITADERTLWNNKSDFSGDYNNLTNAPDIKEDESGEVVYVDKDNNVIAKIGENGFETTQVIANTVIANGVDVGSSLSSHTGNTGIHVTTAERNAWNAKADTTYVDTKVADLVNSAPETLDTLNELAAALGDDPNFAATVATQIGSKVDQTEFDAHTHTKAQVGLGNVDNTSDVNKPVSTAQREALNELKSELSESIVSESKEWIIADNSGNIIAKVDANGLETTTVTADAVVVNGTDLQTTLDGKANAGHTHTVANITDLTATAKELNYMDGVTSNVQTQLDGKANTTHIHPYGVCSSSATYITKAVTVDNFSLVEGARVIVKFTNANNASSPKLNVNDTGAKPIMRYGTTAAGSNTATNGWEAGAVLAFTYDGTNWVQDYWYNTTYTNASLGQGYGTCYTSSSTAEKTVSMSNYEDKTGGIVSIKFTYSVDADATLNINSKGAMDIYYKGSAIVDDVIKGDDIATFICSGSTYHLISVDRWFEDIAELQANDRRVRQMPTSTNGSFRLLLTPSFQSEDTTAYTYFDSDVYLNPYYNILYGVDIDGNAGSASELSDDAALITVEDIDTICGATV